jgi:histidine triad (HIT) family protein
MSECIFCQIASGRIKASILYSDEHVVAFEDVSPQAPTHLVVIPRAHIEGVADLVSEKREQLISKIFEAISKIVTKKGLSSSGYRVVLNQGEDAGQLVPHLHFHVLSGRPFSWPPG